jgi:hypothetical protein
LLRARSNTCSGWSISAFWELPTTTGCCPRIADYARPREVLVSEEARLSAGVEEVDFEPIGDVPLKGVSRAVRLHKAVRAAT